MQYWRVPVVAAGILAASSLALAQTPESEGKKAFTEAANALGMVRGVNRSLEIVNMFVYVAHGTMANPNGGQSQVTKITADYDYVIPAARVEIEKLVDGKAERTIEVAAGAMAWDESKPGIYLRPAATSAEERLKLIWLLPHGVILAGAKAPDKVKLAAKGGLRELTVTLPNGVEVRGLLDAKHLMTQVEMKIGSQVFVGDYSDYKDFQDYGVMFPSRIVQKVDGRILTDLTVTESLANPYMVFPPPKELVQKPSP
jgi:hypothetical protein